MLRRSVLNSGYRIHQQLGQGNRIVMLCTALGKDDTPEWPFWKFQQLRQAPYVRDVAMLAVTREGSFVGRVEGSDSYIKPLRSGLGTVPKRLLSDFLDEFHKPGTPTFATAVMV